MFISDFVSRSSHAVTQQRGFTLTELLVTLVILGLITSFFVPHILSSVGEAQWNAEAENTAMRLYAALEDSKEKLGLLPQDLGAAKALIPRNYVGGDTSFYGTTNIMSVSDPLGNVYGSGLPAGAAIDYLTDQYDPEDRCKTDVGNYTVRWKANTFTANLAPQWNQAYMGDCINLICIFNARQNRRVYVALFRKSNRIITANSVSPTFDSVVASTDCACLTDPYNGTDNCGGSAPMAPPPPPPPPPPACTPDGMGGCTTACSGGTQYHCMNMGDASDPIHKCAIAMCVDAI